MRFGDALLFGALATVLLTTVMSASQGLGWSRISLPYLLGTMFTPRRSRAMTLGYALHFATGCAFALLYALFLERTAATWWVGALLGFVHAAFLLTVGMQLLPGCHPRMAGRHHGPTPTRQLEPPGFLGLHYGRRTPLFTLLAHVLYGSVFGWLY